MVESALFPSTHWPTHSTNIYCLAQKQTRALGHVTAELGKPGSGEPQPLKGPVGAWAGTSSSPAGSGWLQHLGEQQAMHTVSSGTLTNVYKTFSYAVNEPY